ncbi:RidA family protein [Streptomyces sp. NBC_01367]|uniref:RidA family protein n=1 Tax=Streptomyces sp. NBC_01367 TaxID=2903841 RepID=UPI00324E1DF0
MVKLTVYLTDPADLEVALWARDELLGRARPLACSLVTGADPVHPAFRVKVDH